MFPDIGTPIAEAVDTFVDWLVVAHGAFFESVAGVFLAVLVPIEQVLRAAPPPVVLAAVALIAFAASRRLVFAAVMAFLGWLIGCLGLWEPAMQTVALLSVAVGIAVLVGIPVGVLAARSRIARAAINPLLDLMQTIPSFVYLIPAAMLFGLGKVPAILATVVYATPPLIRLTERTCKWPLGDPLKDDFCFCGNDSPDNTPYCTYHQKLAYQPSSERRRVR